MVYTTMRFDFDRRKSRDAQRKQGVSLKEAQEIFDQVYLVDEKSDDPEQCRAIGWSGEYYRLVTAWKATNGEEQHYAENI